MTGNYFNGSKNAIADKTVRAMIEAHEANKITRKFSRNDVEREIDRAVDGNNQKELVSISHQFYVTSSMYFRFVEYFADMLTFYWHVVPRNFSNPEDGLADLFEVLDYLEVVNPEIIGAEIARKVILDGVCYAAVKEKITTKSSTFGLQYLPLAYCKSTKKYNGRSVVSFDLSFFDKNFTKDTKEEALESFPSFIADAYREMNAKKKRGNGSKWVDLDPNYAFQFSLRDDLMPLFLGVIGDLYALQDVKDLSLFKMEQELSKLIIQKFKTDDDGHSVLQREELEAYHHATSRMLDAVPGVDVITTFADIKVEDLNSSQESSTNNPVARKTSDVYTSAGIAQILFNSDSAGALAKSVILDESIMFRLLAQINAFLQVRVDINFKKGDKKAVVYKVTMPQATHMNKEALAKSYKEHGIGFSKLLPFILMGVRQSVALASAVFERDIQLAELLDPTLIETEESSTTEESTGTGQVGRPEKADEEKSEKTEANRETLGG